MMSSSPSWLKALLDVVPFKGHKESPHHTSSIDSGRGRDQDGHKKHDLTTGGCGLRLSACTSAGVDAALIAVNCSSINPSNSCRPCSVSAEQVNTAGNFSNHGEMRSVKAAMFVCTAAADTLSVLVKTRTNG